VTDEELDTTLADDYSNWSDAKTSYIPAINRQSDLLILWQRSQLVTIQTVANLQVYTNLIRSALDTLPPQLQWRGGLSRPPQSNFGTDAQTANLYITQLHIRYNLLEQMVDISHQPGATTSGTSTPELTSERQSIVEDMLQIVQTVPRTIIQASGASLVHKIRDIGAALLEQPEPNVTLVSDLQRNNKLCLVLRILEELEGQA